MGRIYEKLKGRLDVEVCGAYVEGLLNAAANSRRENNFTAADVYSEVTIIEHSHALYIRHGIYVSLFSIIQTDMVVGKNLAVSIVTQITCN